MSLILASFLPLPQTKIELIMDDGLSNIIADGCDVGIRLEQGLDEYMTAIPVSPLIKLVTVASPDYLKRTRYSWKTSELSNHNCLRLQHKSSGALSAWEFSNVVGVMKSSK